MRTTNRSVWPTLFLACFVGGQAMAESADLLVRNGLVFDGHGNAPVHGDVAVRDGKVIAVGKLTGYTAGKEIDAGGLAVAPGFINVLSWATESLLHDGRAMSDIKQGVTLEIFGEGNSYGPVNDVIREEMIKTQGDIRYDVTWKTLDEYLTTLTKRGVSPNVASFIGATTVREYVIGFNDRAPTPAELQQMQELVREAMRDGALGVGSSLIYAPAAYAKTDELVALAKAAGEFGGTYVSHMRSEGDRFLEALDELLLIAREGKVHGEIYHLKAAGEKNWPKMQQAIAKIEAARKEGLSVAANMYAYTAGATGLDAAMPPWVQEGGLDAWVERLKQPAIRERCHALVLRLPVLGAIARGADTARLASTLGILVQSGVPLLQALAAGARVVGNVVLRAAVEEAGARVREGTSLHRALGAGRRFPPIFIHLVASGLDPWLVAG